jgi:hypothetical protein
MEKINSLRGTNTILTPLLDLTKIIEEQIQNIISIYQIKHKETPTLPIINTLTTFYSQQELHHRQIQFDPHHNIADQLLSRAPSISTTTTAPSIQTTVTTNPSYFVEDMAINAILEIVEAQMIKDKTQMETEEGVEATPLVPTTVNLTLETPILQRVRFNLIRHR